MELSMPLFAMKKRFVKIVAVGNGCEVTGFSAAVPDALVAQG
jgi:hypothetical protein